MAGTTSKKRIAINLYLLKKNLDPSSKGLWSKDDILAQPIGKSGKNEKIQAEIHSLVAQNITGTLYIRNPITESEPEWLDFVREGLKDHSPLSRLKNKSVSAIVLVSQNHRQFVITFGHGRFMIEPRLIEDRFGIKVVLNSISPDEVASIDRQTFDASPKISRVQTIKASAVSDFMISPEQDLLRGLVGFTKPEYEKVLGKVIAGIDSFKTSVPINLSDIPELLRVALERSESKDYLAPDPQGNNSQFAWVENLLPVKDKALIDKLDDDLWTELHKGNLTNKWLAIPDIVDWSQVTGFSYKPITEEENIEANLDLNNFLQTLRKGATLETIKNREIYLQMANGIPPVRFSAFKCIYAEIQNAKDLFILHVGTWFKVEDNFKKSVEKYFTDIPRKKFALPFIEYNHSGEGHYNEAVCKKSPHTHVMLDRKLIQFGGTYDKIEVCDILGSAPTGNEFIHVKRGRSSSTLSHLFAQGLVASTLLVREKNFVNEVNKQLSKLKITPLPVNFSAKGNSIVYAIIDGQAGTTLSIPFFSKVTLQHCGKSISAFGYSVSLMHIPESSAYLARKAKKGATKKTNTKKGTSHPGSTST